MFLDTLFLFIQFFIIFISIYFLHRVIIVILTCQEDVQRGRWEEPRDQSLKDWMWVHFVTSLYMLYARLGSSWDMRKLWH